MNNDFDGMNLEIVGDLHEFPNGPTLRLLGPSFLKVDRA